MAVTTPDGEVRRSRAMSRIAGRTSFGVSANARIAKRCNSSSGRIINFFSLYYFVHHTCDELDFENFLLIRLGPKTFQNRNGRQEPVSLNVLLRSTTAMRFAL
jgi:hypothetical protein